jgi:hypothetical protein
MVEPSEEQNVIIEYLKQGVNVVVEAVAGSGKSTTVIAAALAMPSIRILHVTYNTMLRLEFKAKCAEIGIHNIDVHTYHSLASHHFGIPINTDSKLALCFNFGMGMGLELAHAIPAYDLFVLDELQDCCLMFFQFAVWFAAHIPRKIQLLCLGDVRQKIYGFKGADHRFLTFAPELWRDQGVLSSQTFISCTLQTTYRATIPIAQFVNCAMLGEARLRTNKPGPRVSYICQKDYKSLISKIVLSILTILKSGASPGDIFILANSLRKDFISKLENALVSRKIPCHLSLQNEKNNRITKNKVEFSTLCKCKGRQRRFVFVLGFASMLRDDDPEIKWGECPNVMYVACTRATEQLFVVESNEYLSGKPKAPDFLRISYPVLKDVEFVEFVGEPCNIPVPDPNSTNSSKKTKQHIINMASAAFFISGEAETQISTLMDSIFVRISSHDPLDIQEYITTHKGLCENINSINHIAITTMFYDTVSAKNASKTMCANIITKIDSVVESYVSFAAKNLPDECITPADYLRVATVFDAIENKLHSTLAQIGLDEYTWLDSANTQKCVEWLDECMGAELRAGPFNINTYICNANVDHTRIYAALFSAFQEYSFEYFSKRITFSATIDVESQSALWIMIYTHEMEFDDKFKIAIKVWLSRLAGPTAKTDKPVYVINVMTQEQFRIDATTECLTQIVAIGLYDKYRSKCKMTDPEFIKKCLEITSIGGPESGLNL